MYTITKKKGSANIIWDPKAEKPLCKFTQGFFSTSDKDIADRLAKLGHKVEGLAEKAEAKQETGAIDVASMTTAQLKALAKEKGIDLKWANKKADIIALLKAVL